jgi:hypothetical protein
VVPGTYYAGSLVVLKAGLDMKRRKYIVPVENQTLTPWPSSPYLAATTIEQLSRMIRIGV